MADVLSRLASDWGYGVRFTGGWEDARGSGAEPRTTSLRESVEGVLAGYRHYAVFDDEAHTVTVRVLERCQRPGGAAEAVDFTDADPAIRASALREALGVDAVPPELSLQAAILYQGCAPEGAAAHPGAVEVVPPGPDGVAGPTLEQAEAAAGGAPRPDPSEVELVPAGHE